LVVVAVGLFVAGVAAEVEDVGEDVVADDLLALVPPQAARASPKPAARATSFTGRTRW
jgi:hypothetical protein